MKRAFSHAILFNLSLLGLFVLYVGHSSTVLAQQTSDKADCQESYNFYILRKYIVKNISIRPFVRFMPGGPALQESLNAASANLKSTPSEFQVGDAFNLGKISVLQAELSSELESRLLKGKTGFLYLVPRLRNCQDEADPPTLEVEYHLLTVARPSYLTSTYEIYNSKDQEREKSGKSTLSENDFVDRPYAGYNRSRGIYAGNSLSLRSDHGIINRLYLDGSGSGSSGVVDLSLSGSRDLASGPLSYAEWTLGYRYSNIPTDTIRLKDATMFGQFSGVSRPIISNNLFFRFGTSIEGGYRQTSLDQNDVSASDLAQSSYGGIKFYGGGTFSSSRQDWKASYGLQLGDSDNGGRVDYVKHIFDTAYRMRYLPRDYMPMQLDAQFTAGSLRAVSGSIPVGERFFGGNVEREFIAGDSWRIRSNPFIRSFPENRLNRSTAGLPIGGENFISFNLTLAQTVWSRQLVPKEITEDDELLSILGAPLLTTRLTLREAEIQSSTQIKNLHDTIHDLTPILGKLRADLSEMKKKTLPESVLKAVDEFESDPDMAAAPIQDIEDAVEAATIDTDAATQPVADQAALSINTVEVNAKSLIEGDPENDVKPLIEVLREKILNLQQKCAEAGLTAPPEVVEVDGKLTKSKSDIRNGLTFINQLREYTASEIKPLIDSLNDTAPGSSKSLDKIVDEIRSQLNPILKNAQQELKDLPVDRNDDSVELKRQDLNDLIRLLEAGDSLSLKAKDAFNSANDLNSKKQYADAKWFVESLAIGFGIAIPSYLSGIAHVVDKLQAPLTSRGLTQDWDTLKNRSQQLLAIQGVLRSRFKAIPVPEAEQKADQVVSYTKRVLGVFFRELNLVGVSPVLMFDAARIGPVIMPGEGGFRYGLGAGVRFSLVNLDFTAGYSVNLKRRPGEGRGAFVFTLDVNDLFR